MKKSNINKSEKFPTYDAWFNALIGQSKLNEDLDRTMNTTGHREGKFMRMIFLNKAHENKLDKYLNINLAADEKLGELTILRMEQNWRIFRKRAIAEGLWPDKVRIDMSRNKSPYKMLRSLNFPNYVIAAGIIAIVFGLNMQLQNFWQIDKNQEDEIIFRGNEQTQRLLVPTKQSATRLADQIESILVMQNKKDSAYRYIRKEINPNLIQIQAKIIPNSSVVKDLEDLGVVVPSHGRLNLIIEQGKF